MRSKGSYNFLLVLLLVFVVAACGTSPAPEPTATATTPAEAPQPTVPAPTVTASPRPSDTPPATDPPQPEASPTPTYTPTPLVVAPAPTTPAPADSRCDGLDGTIEVRVLVGPAEVVGLEPFAVGSVPFAVTTDQAPFVVQGSGPISYEDVLVQEWGTYEVTMNLDATVSGECADGPDGEILDLVVEVAGEQMVVVDAEGFYGEYPWKGTVSVPALFPLQEGATAEGEGWVLVLHLQTP